MARNVVGTWKISSTCSAIGLLTLKGAAKTLNLCSEIRRSIVPHGHEMAGCIFEGGHDSLVSRIGGHSEICGSFEP